MCLVRSGIITPNLIANLLSREALWCWLNHSNSVASSTTQDVCWAPVKTTSTSNTIKDTCFSGAGYSSSKSVPRQPSLYTATFQIFTWNLGFTKIQLFHCVLDSDIFGEGWLFLFPSPRPCPEAYDCHPAEPPPTKHSSVETPTRKKLSRSLWREMSFLDFFLIKQKPAPLLSWARWIVQVLRGPVTVQETCCWDRDRRCPLTSGGFMPYLSHAVLGLGGASFLPVLLRYNWHTALYMFKVYSPMIWFYIHHEMITQ